jgi:hypothetical protein
MREKYLGINGHAHYREINMFGSDVIDVGIGMSLLFLMMSLIATAVREAIEGALKNRATYLENGLREMLNDTVKGNYDGLVGQIYKHGLVNSLYRGKLDPAGKSNDLPSYIPSKTFVSAFLDIVLRTKVPPAAPQGGDPAPPVAAISPGAALPDSGVRNELTFDNLKGCANNLPPQIKQIVLGAIDDAQDNIDSVRTNLEDWFNSSMDRVSGWYRRRTQLILFLIGIIAACVLNVDSITIAQRLTNDKTLREGIIATVQQKDAVPAADSSKSYEQLTKELNNIGFPIGWTRADEGTLPYPEAQMCKTETSKAEPGKSDPGKSVTKCDYTTGALFKAIVGWFVTAFAIMLGAPFWFDVLNRFMVVRSTIKPSEKSKEEPSKDGASPSPVTLLVKTSGDNLQPNAVTKAS